MKKQSPPIVPGRGFSIPIVTPTETGFLFYTMLRSYNTAVTSSSKAGAAAMAFGHLLHRPELLCDRVLRQVAMSALLDIEYTVRSLSDGGPLSDYFLRDTAPRVRSAIVAATKSESRL
jgi:hypothetical protein